MSDWAYWVRRNIIGQSADTIVKDRYGGHLEVCRKAVFIVQVLGGDAYVDDKIRIEVSTEDYTSEYHDVAIFNQADEDGQRMEVFKDRWARTFVWYTKVKWAFWRRGFWMEHLDYMYKVAREREVGDRKIKNAPIMTEVGYEE